MAAAPAHQRDLHDASLAGRNAVVTGGGGGIGARLVDGMAQRGARVIAVDRDKDALDRVVNACRSRGGEVQGALADVAQEGSLDVVANEAIGDHGRLDIWVNNAGVFDVRPALEVSSGQWDDTMTVNARGVFLGCRAAATHMCQERLGAIVNIASTAAVTARPLIGPYCASKAAVAQLTKALAAEWGPMGVRVNAVAPGFIDTSMLSWITEDPDVAAREREAVPLRRFGTADDVLGAVLYLVSDAASYVTGTTLVVDGGLTLG